MSKYAVEEILPAIEEEARRQGVDPAFAKAILASENSGSGVLQPGKMVDLGTQGIDPKTGKPSGALGIFQVVGSTLQGLKDQGRVPADINYMTLPGQIQAGIAAMKEKIEHATKMVGKYDPLAAAAYYVDGHAGLRGYMGKGAMPEQTVGYLKKMSRAMNMGTTAELSSWGNENRMPTPVPPEVAGAMAMQDPSTTATLPPMPGMPAFGSELTPSLEMLQAIGAMVGESGKEAKAASKQKMEAQVLGAEAAAQREAQTLQQKLNLQALYGTNPLDNSSRLVENLTRAEVERQKALAIKPEIDRLMSIDPLANPVGWFAAQFQLGGLVATHNAAVQNRNTANREVATQYALQERAESLTPAITMDTIHKDQVAKVKMAEATAMAESAQVDRQNIGLQNQVLSEKMQWLMQDEQLKNVKYRNLMERYQFQEAQDLKDAEKEQIARINFVLTKYGSPPITWKVFKSLPKEEQDALATANPMPSSPGQAIQNIERFGDVNAMQRGSASSKAMADQAAVILKLAKPKIDAEMMKPGAGKIADIQKKAINDLYTGWRDELKQGDMMKSLPENPYRISVVQAAQAKELGNNKLAQWALDTAKKMPNGAIGEKEVLAQATARIRAGENIDAVSLDVSEFFSKGYEHQFQSRGLGTLGFDSRMPNGKREYNIGSNVFGPLERMFGGMPSIDRPVDMMNSTSVKQFLMETQIKMMIQSSGGLNLGARGNPNLAGQIEDLQRQTGAGQ